LNSVPQLDSDTLVYVDIGGAGGFKYTWPSYPTVQRILFEPNSKSMPYDENGYYMYEGLGDKETEAILWQTRSMGCCSVLKPNFKFLQNYTVRPAFEIIGCHQITLTTYSTLYQQNRVPIPDVLKIDTQGFEYEILKGFGELLHHVVAIELETHLYEVYENQKLFHNIARYLSDFGLVCKSLKPLHHWDGHLVEFDAVFTKTATALTKLPPQSARKLEAVIKDLEIAEDVKSFHPSFIF
jgi:hypothetical protein